MGFRTVAISNGPQKEEYSKKLGADVYIDMSKQDVGAELVRDLAAALLDHFL